ncbi:hypothetical protein Amal_03554 [Acetobacter malorum]|uniref:Uncharacterized protein n=1 Tax=Acetobacter malorum TaxID=178901 RepID=A0A177G7N4_9PROT|nr:hypothetical protein Amal_03554 [Acetobacter malorum]
MTHKGAHGVIKCLIWVLLAICNQKVDIVGASFGSIAKLNKRGPVLSPVLVYRRYKPKIPTNSS